MAEKISESRRLQIFAVFALMMGFLLGVLLEYNNNLNQEARIIHKLNMISACNSGCYHVINLVINESETVQENYPNTFTDCKTICVQQYG